MFPLKSHLTVGILRSFLENSHLYACCKIVDTSTSCRIVEYAYFISTLTEEVYSGLQRHHIRFCVISTGVKNTKCLSLSTHRGCFPLLVQ